MATMALVNLKQHEVNDGRNCMPLSHVTNPGQQ